jgi:thiol-disulfide isomerase/thioredoxin
MVYRYAYEYDLEAKPGPAELAFVPAERQRADMLSALVARPSMPEPGEFAGGDDGEAGGGMAGRPAPAFVLSTLDGGAVDLELLRGKVVVLDFWATWCGPCRQALPLLHQVAEWVKRRELPVEIVTINVWEIRDGAANNPDARIASARKYWEGQKFTLPVAMDFTDEVGASYGVRGIPTTVVIRPDGIVHEMHSGAGPDYAKDLQAVIEAALGDEGAPEPEGE